MNLICYAIVLIYLLFINLTTVIITKKKFGESLIISLLLPAFLLYISQMIFKTFQVGYIISIIYALFSIFYLIYNIKNKKELLRVKDNYLTNGFYAFLTIFFILVLFDYNRVFMLWDERSHWGVMIKEMFRLDKFYSVKESFLQVHKDYPPILQLYELNIVKLIGSFKENYAIFSIHLLELSLFIPFILEKKKAIIKTIVQTLIIVMSVTLMTLMFDQDTIIFSIYNDYFMAILVAFILIFIFKEKKLTDTFSLLMVSLLSSTLLLTKQIGLTLYLMMLFLYFGCYILENKKLKNIFNKKNIKNLIKIIVVIVVIPLLLWFMWNNHTKALNLEGQFKLSDIKLSKLYDVSKGKGEYEYQTTSYKNYIVALRSRSITTSYIELTYFQAIFVLVLLIYFVYKKYKTDLKQNKIYLLICALLIGAFGYSFVMLCTYVFCFKEIEGPNLASFPRYMSTYVLIVAYSLMMLFIYMSTKKEKLKALVVVLVVLFAINSGKSILRLTPTISRVKENIYETSGNILKQYVEEKSKVFIVAQNSSGDYQYFIKYYANPILVNTSYYIWPNENSTKYYEEVKKEIEKYDYIYIANIDDEFIKNYGYLFKDIKNQQIYKIIKKNNDIIYEKVN